MSSPGSAPPPEAGRWTWDIRNDLVTLGPAFMSVVGHPVQAGPVRFDFLCKLVHPYDLSSFRAAIEAQIDGTGAAGLDFRVITHWGEVRDVVATWAVLERDPAGRAVRLAASVTPQPGPASAETLDPP